MASRGKHSALLLALVCLLCTAAKAQRPNVRWLSVKSCASADSLLGPVGADRKALVSGYYRGEEDETWLTGGRLGPSHASPRFLHQIAYTGSGPIAVSDSVAWQVAKFSIALFVKGQAARDLLATGALPPATFVLDDSVTIVIDTPVLGKYQGPPSSAVAPVSLDIRRHQLQLLRAHRVTLLLGDERYDMTQDELRDLRGVYRVAACSGASK